MKDARDTRMSGPGLVGQLIDLDENLSVIKRPRKVNLLTDNQR